MTQAERVAIEKGRKLAKRYGVSRSIKFCSPENPECKPQFQIFKFFEYDPVKDELIKKPTV